MTAFLSSKTPRSVLTRRAYLIAPLMMMALTGCSDGTDNSAQSTSGADDTPQHIKIATESSYKPFSYTDADGNLIGYEIDLLNALCDEMRADCEIISQDWDGLIPGLNAQKFDAIMAGISITPERREVVEFTDPYFHSGIILMAKKGDDVSINSLAGVPVAAQRSTISSQYLQDAHSEADIKLYDTQDNAYLDLTAGRARAMMSDKVTGIDWLKTDAGQNFEIKGDEISTDEDAMGIAMRKGDPLVGKFNQALAAIKANGTYDAITDSYFGTSSTKAAVNAEVTTTDEVNDVVVPADTTDTK